MTRSKTDQPNGVWLRYERPLPPTAAARATLRLKLSRATVPHLSREKGSLPNGAEEMVGPGEAEPGNEAERHRRQQEPLSSLGRSGGEAPHRAVVRDQHPVGVAGRGEALRVHDLGLRLVKGPPAGATEPPAEVHVLHVHEVGLVEAADRLEGEPPHEEARARDPVCLPLAVLLATEPPVPAGEGVASPHKSEEGVADRVAERGEGPSRGVDVAAGVADEGSGDRERLVGLEPAKQRRHRAGTDDEVRVAHEQERARGRLRPEVGAGAVAEVAAGFDDLDRRVALGAALARRRSSECPLLEGPAQRGERVVDRGVVDDAHLRDPVRDEALHAGGEGGTGVVVDDDGAERQPAHRSSATSRPSDSCHGGRSPSPARRRAALSSTEFAGRRAGRGGSSSAVAIGSTRFASRPAARSTSQANPNQVVSPWFVTWKVPGRRARPSSTTFSARSPATVGQPRWSSTKRSTGWRSATSSTVLAMLRPARPTTHEVLTTVQAGSTSCSPASLERP